MDIMSEGHGELSFVIRLFQEVLIKGGRFKIIVKLGLDEVCKNFKTKHPLKTQNTQIALHLSPLPLHFG